MKPQLTFSPSMERTHYSPAAFTVSFFIPEEVAETLQPWEVESVSTYYTAKRQGSAATDSALSFQGLLTFKASSSE